jgi:hypothetical protein
VNYREYFHHHRLYRSLDQDCPHAEVDACYRDYEAGK